MTLPSTRMLRTFESAGRLGSFSRAAEELQITRSVVSLAIAELERRIAVRLFERHHRSVSLTEAGELYYRAVADGLARIADATARASAAADDDTIVVACGRVTSELFLMPRFAALRAGLGEDATVRVLRCEPSFLDRPDVMDIDRIDLIVSYQSAAGVPGDRVVFFHEAMAPVCSPNFAAAHEDALRRPVARWGSLPFLCFSRPTRGWAIWDDWFEAAGRPEPEPRYVNYDDYIHMIDAAVAGRGLALGWRNFMNRFFDVGSLVMVVDGFMAFDRPLAVRLTARGQQRPLARRCLDIFASLAG